jgi:hypothetical protein
MTMQELIKKIFGDEKTKAQFVSDPERVLSEYTLTEQEKTAVMSTYTRLGLVTADSQVLREDIGPMSTWH